MAFGWDEDEIAAQLGHCGRRLHSSALFLVESALQTRVRNEVRGRTGQPPPLPIPTLHAPVVRPLARETLRPLQPGVCVARSIPIHSVGTNFEAKLARALAASTLDILKANLEHSTKGRQILNATTEHAEQFLIVTGDFLAFFSPDSLQAALAAWRRWGVWVALHGNSFLVLPAEHIPLTLFLRGVYNGSGIARRNAGGQGAVERVRASLAFLAKHLGLDIRAADLSPSSVVPVVNKVGQQLEKRPANAEVAPLLPRDFVILTKLSRSVRGVVSFMACCVLIHALGGVRFRHLQRSIETEFDVRRGIFFRCEKGKTRSQGAPAKAFHWVITTSSFFPVSIAQEFLTNIKRFR